MIDGLIAGKVYNQLQSRNDAKRKTFRTLLWRCGTLPGQLLGLAPHVRQESRSLDRKGFLGGFF